MYFIDCSTNFCEIWHGGSLHNVSLAFWFLDTLTDYNPYFAYVINGFYFWKLILCFNTHYEIWIFIILPNTFCIFAKIKFINRLQGNLINCIECHWECCTLHYGVHTSQSCYTRRCKLLHRGQHCYKYRLQLQHIK
jgi:hypothetical protein